MQKILVILFLFPPLLAKADIIASGNDCGENCHWSISDDGKLIVSGSGKIKDYDINSEYTYVHEGETTPAPWHNYRDQISSVTVSEGISDIGQKAFYDLYNVTNVSLPETLSSLGAWSFAGNSSLTNINLPSSLSYIEGGSFERTGLINIDIPDSVTYMGYCTFLGTPLQSISLSDKVLATGGDPFRDSDITGMKIYCKGNVETCKSHFPDRYDGIIKSYPKPAKRIYTVEEAAKLSKKTGNTFKLRYK